MSAPLGSHEHGLQAFSQWLTEMVQAFRGWLERVLNEGESVQGAVPELSADAVGSIEEMLRAAFELHILDVAGPPVSFDANIAILAAEILARACWFLTGASEGENVKLATDVKPATPSAHLSADLTFRFLPAIYRRARLHNPEGALVHELDRLLRVWPLSGVLADLDGEPLTPTDFGGHPGLQLLYAERLVGTGRAGWLPPPGPAKEWVERVFHERGKPLPAPIPVEDQRA
jgi:hypothetical protein